MARNLTIDFDGKLFCPNFHWAIKCINDEKLRVCFFYGGSSSAKTYSLVQAIILQTLIHGTNTIIFRKVSAHIRKSIYKDFVQVIKTLKLSEYFNVLAFNIRCKLNGAIIDFSGLDDEEKIKGIASYKYIMVDEVTALEHSEFKQLLLRMRGIPNQKLLLTFNPISDTHWLKTEVYDKLPLKSLDNRINDDINTEVTEVETYDNYIFIKSTYLNNFYVCGSPCKTFGFVDEQTIKVFEAMKVTDIEYYNIYALGNFGKINRGGEFYKNFNKKLHTSSFDIDEELPLHLSFDENVHPYMTLTITQTEDDYIKVVDEILGRSPHNNVKSLIKLFVNKYKEYKNSKIFIYGDATSRRADSRTEDGFNLYGIIITELENSGFKNIISRVPTSNPSVSMSGDFVNALFAGRTSKTFLIEENCRTTIADFENLMEDKDGGILKSRVKDKELGITYEKYGHCSDSLRYLIISYMNEEYNKFIDKGNENYQEYNVNLFDEDDDNYLSF